MTETESIITSAPPFPRPISVNCKVVVALSAVNVN
jgi:hypothetical protein